MFLFEEYFYGGLDKSCKLNQPEFDIGNQRAKLTYTVIPESIKPESGGKTKRFLSAIPGCCRFIFLPQMNTDSHRLFDENDLSLIIFQIISGNPWLKSYLQKPAAIHRNDIGRVVCGL